MRKYITVNNKVEFIKLLLRIVHTNNLTLVLEYENKEFYDAVQSILQEKKLPDTARHYLNYGYFLKAFKVESFDYYFIACLCAYVSTLTVFDDNEMQFLIGDNFHKDCFSCSEQFYKRINDEINPSCNMER